MQSYLIALVLTFTSTSLCQAQNKPASDTSPKHPPKEAGTHRKPPPHAFDLCKGKKEGKVVQIVTPRGKTIDAKCASSNEGLFARPEHPPRDDKDE